MNLKTHIRPELWQAIANTYETENYAHAVLDAMHFLSDVIRRKTGVDGDGVSLAGQALGGDSPRLRVNKMQTETERSIQRGIEQLLRGLYMGIRNPRSHEQFEDSKGTAVPIIYFIDYILSLIIESEDPFTIDGFLERVFDSDFVESDRYAELLANEIPINKRLDTAIDIYNRRLEGDGRKLSFMFNALLALLSEEELQQFLSVVSDDLKSQQHDKAIRFTLQILPPSLWSNLSEVSRLRIENKLIQSIEEGIMDPNYHRTQKGALGTWARDFARYFDLRDKLARQLVSKIEKGTPRERAYGTRFFMTILPQVAVSAYLKRRCINAISESVRKDEHVLDDLISAFPGYPEDWQMELLEKLDDMTDPDNPALYLPDGTPFLRRIDFEDEIPF